MKFATYSALVLALFLGETEAVTLRQLCPGDDDTAKKVIKAMLDEPETKQPCGCGHPGCKGCGAKEEKPVTAKKVAKEAAKAAKTAVEKVAKKIEKTAEKKEVAAK